MDNQQKETIFANGFIFKRPHANSPDFVKGSMSIKSDEAIEFIQKHTKRDGWINLDLLASKDNSKLYFKVNEWEKPADAVNPVTDNTGSDDRPQAVKDAQAEEVLEVPF